MAETGHWLSFSGVFCILWQKILVYIIFEYDIMYSVIIVTLWPKVVTDYVFLVSFCVLWQKMLLRWHIA